MVGLALLCGALGGAPARSQDVAEAARQERERKAAREKNPHHIYTEEDLKRAKILTPEDDARIVSRKATTPVPQQQGHQLQVAEQPQESPSLGEVAQRYREQKAALQEEPVAKEEEESRYPLELPAVMLAQPKPVMQPNINSLREDELPTTKRTSTAAAAASSRISRFAPRNVVAPAGVQPVGPVVVVASLVRKKQVLPGDSWWKLAQRYLGQGSRWQELWRVNPGLNRNPNRLAAGAMVFVPELTPAGGSPPGPPITVQAGDTLWSLAREQLGCAQRWPALAAANPQVTNYKKLQIGTKLNFPDGQQHECFNRTRHFPQN
jgi:nucleoid-associated protein YgaU